MCATLILLTFVFHARTTTIASKDTPISHKRKTSIIMEMEKFVGAKIGQQGLLEKHTRDVILLMCNTLVSFTHIFFLCNTFSNTVSLLNLVL